MLHNYAIHNTITCQVLPLPVTYNYHMSYTTATYNLDCHTLDITVRCSVLQPHIIYCYHITHIVLRQDIYYCYIVLRQDV